MKIPDLIAQHLIDVHEGNNWTGVDLAQTVKDLSFPEAYTLTQASPNTIASIINHLTFWNGIMQARLKHIQTAIPAENGFTISGLQDDETWQRIREDNLHSVHELAAAIRKLDDRTLEDPILPGYPSIYKNLQGMVEHAHYHLGQIMVIKNLLRTSNTLMILLFLMLLHFRLTTFAQDPRDRHEPAKAVAGISPVWVADQGDGTYKNPVLNADYSDPDAIRVGDDFFLVSSSFEDIPGLPLLHSKDLVNWQIISHALRKQPPYDSFAFPRHGDGVWAPSIRYYRHEFYIYYPDPDYGIYLVKAGNPSGPWSEPVLVMKGKGIIDPCPLMDDNGEMYLIHAFAGSRAGIKSILAINKLNSDGSKVIDDGVIVYDGHELDPTIEGPKLYKRNGYYYILAPAGGVSGGWQLALRSRHIYGPYERRVVMDQGKSTTNGPHQGAWVTTSTGEDWFLHFQDKGAYGRVVHLQPMKWKDNWPVIGIDPDGDGKGEPVSSYKKPDVGKTVPVTTPPETDEFNGSQLGLQWQWMANARPEWMFMNVANGSLRLYSAKIPTDTSNLWNTPNVLLQKFPADEFTATTKLTFTPNARLADERTGLTIMGMSYASLALRNGKNGIYLVYGLCKDAEKGGREIDRVITTLDTKTIFLRVKVSQGAACNFSYSIDGVNFTSVGENFVAQPGRWTGAKVGIFCTRDSQTNDSGYADFDWFRISI